MLEYIVIIGAVASTIGAATYIYSMFRGNTKPNRVSWLLWAIAPLIATAAGLSKGAGWAALPVFMSGFSPVLIFAASFLTKKAYWKLTVFDYICGAISALALILWLATSDANIAIIFSMISDGTAAIPTVTKAWKTPESESPWPFLIGIFSPATAFAVVSTWSFSEVAFPAYLVFINVVLVVAVYNKKFRFKKQHPS
jgi:hypothetical protein